MLTSAPQTLTIGATDVTFGATSATTTSVNGRQLGVAAYPGLTGTWAAFEGSTGSIRTSPSVLQCFSFDVTGTGNDRKLTVGWLGGSGFTVANQCAPDAIAQSPTSFDAPYCASLPGSLSPWQSVILGQYTYAGGADSTSGAGAVGLALAAAFAAGASLLLLL